MDTFSKLQYHLVNNNGQTTCYIHNEKGDTIAVMRRDDAPSTKIQGQWAKEIVNRYNAHDSLTEALTKLHYEYRFSKITEAMRQGASHKDAIEFADNIEFVKAAKQMLEKTKEQ